MPGWGRQGRSGFCGLTELALERTLWAYGTERALERTLWAHGAGSRADSVGSRSGLWRGLCGLTERSGLWSALCGLTEWALERTLVGSRNGPGSESERKWAGTVALE